MSINDTILEASIHNIEVSPRKKIGYYPIILTTDRGELKCRYYHSTGEKKAVIFAGGGKTGFGSPAGMLYPSLCRSLHQRNISSLRIKFRYPDDLMESVLDMMVAITFLERFGTEKIGIVGYSKAGTVAIQAAAAASDIIKTIVTLGAQASGAEPASILERTSLLVIHGANDEIIPAHSSTYIHTLAQGEKQLLVYQGATHSLNEVSNDVRNKIKKWLLKHLR